MRISLQTTIDNAKKLDTQKEQIELLISWLEGTTSKLLKPQTVRTIAEFVDDLMDGFTPWPKLTVEGTHSCYLEKEIFLKILDIAAKPYNAEKKAFELAKTFEEKRFLTLAFKWYSLSSYLGNQKGTEKIFNLYSKNTGIINLVSFSSVRELIFKSTEKWGDYFDLDRALYWLSQHHSDIDSDATLQESIDEQKKLNAEIEVWDILLRFEFNQVDSEFYPSDLSNFRSLYDKLEKELKHNIPYETKKFWGEKLIEVACLSEAIFGKKCYDLPKIKFWNYWRESYFLSFLNLIKETYGDDSIIDFSFAMHIVEHGDQQESAEYVAKYILSNLDKISEYDFKATFEKLHGLRREQFCDAFLGEYSSDFLYNTDKNFDPNFLIYLFQQCNCYCSETYKFDPAGPYSALNSFNYGLISWFWEHKAVKETAALVAENEKLRKSIYLPTDWQFNQDHVIYVLSESEILDVDSMEFPLSDEVISLLKELKKHNIDSNLFKKIGETLDLYIDNESCRDTCLRLADAGIAEASSVLSYYCFLRDDEEADTKAAYYLVKAKEQGANIVDVLKEKFEIDISKPEEIPEWKKSLLYELEKLGIKFINTLGKESKQTISKRRRICFDTETTGLSPNRGDKLCEIAAVEFDENYRAIAFFQTYINPGIKMPYRAYQIHGLSDSFLSNKPKFKEVAAKFLDFVRGAELFAHNSNFDQKFLDNELMSTGLPTLHESDCLVVDTLSLARKNLRLRHNKLTDLCTYFGIDQTSRELHGALIDSCLLVSVLANLRGTTHIKKSVSIKGLSNAAIRPLSPSGRSTSNNLNVSTTIQSSYSGKKLGWFEIGNNFYSEGNYAEAFDCYQRSVKAGETCSYFQLGYLCAMGLGVQKDTKRAEYYYKKHIEVSPIDEPNCKFAHYNLALLYFYGQIDGTRNLFLSRQHWKNAAFLGFAPAMYFYGRALLNGEGGPQDTSLARLWFYEGKKAGNKNCAEILNTLDTALSKDSTVPSVTSSNASVRTSTTDSQPSKDSVTNTAVVETLANNSSTTKVSTSNPSKALGKVNTLNSDNSSKNSTDKSDYKINSEEQTDSKYPNNFYTIWILFACLILVFISV